MEQREIYFSVGQEASMARFIAGLEEARLKYFVRQDEHRGWIVEIQ
jgi:hypothetical protein